MSLAVAAVNLLLGAVYIGIGTLAIIDFKRGWKTLGFSPFGAAFIGLAFTCGPHHLDHGYHVLAYGRSGGVLDLIAVVIGLPAGGIFVWLRHEAFFGGAGDRHIEGTPWWISAVPMVWGAYVTALIAAALWVAESGVHLPAAIWSNIGLVGIYVTIGYFLLRTQLRNHSAIGGWSLSGLSLMAVFPTCALMHGAYITYAMTARYEYDVHGFVIDWLSVPTGLYFLWVVRGLYRDSIRDWNRTFAEPAKLRAGV